MFGINKNDLQANAKALFKIKPINIFTSRGIRFSRQVVYKKTGKVSSYR
jgi:ribosomal protein L6P/L9E